MTAVRLWWDTNVPRQSKITECAHLPQFNFRVTFHGGEGYSLTVHTLSWQIQIQMRFDINLHGLIFAFLILTIVYYPWLNFTIVGMEIFIKAILTSRWIRIPYVSIPETTHVIDIYVYIYINIYMYIYNVYMSKVRWIRLRSAIMLNDRLHNIDMMS